MNKRIPRERPFEYFRAKDGRTPLPEETVKNWYVARAFVLERLKDISFPPGSDGHLHVTVDGDAPVMLAVLRQLALSAHYPNFVEYDSIHDRVCRNRSVLTLVSKKDAAGITAEIGKAEYLCNLVKYCKCTVYGDVRNEDSFLDVELEITHEAAVDPNGILFRQEDVTAFMQAARTDDVYSIDTRKAIFADRAYRLGSDVDNIPYEGIFTAGRYNRALDTFRYRVLEDGPRDGGLVSSQWRNDFNAVRKGLSIILSADCFESRELAMKQLCPGYDDLSLKKKKALWEKYNEALSLSEHGRWTVEKLILGYAPLSQSQCLKYESLFGKRRAAYCAGLKNDITAPAHLDICSFWDLRRIDPDNIKYDSFLMLAIPLILDKIRVV